VFNKIVWANVVNAALDLGTNLKPTDFKHGWSS